MKLKIETKRLVLRELLFSDAEAMFKMDSNPNVHTFLGSTPVKTIDDVNDFISDVRTQYVVNKIGRFAIIHKDTNEFIGWAGLRFVIEPENELVNFFDLSYRLQEEHWGKGYAKEAAQAWLSYGFSKMKKHNIYASIHIDNRISKRILEKIGMTQKSEYKWNDIPCAWFEITKEEYSKS
ncbi:GNAT family N-acetyltransferase [Flavobacterium sp.]|jgi:RimJ/RimL family protein N-acetyltransferase|uniref:GNAT family N-acetyltransferase n=1 Tax=Flavobacterium sp. TaxID=239 RepID=UPI002A8150EE|nr:GNAT family N-acetyltransferase [Flavobacterium sp.]